MLKISSRNCFEGKIANIVAGAINDEVQIEVAGGVVITATITQQSTKRLGLEVGKKAYALIKAPLVIVMAGKPEIQFSTRNIVTGKVLKVTTGAVNAEVVIEAAGGLQVVAIITNESVKNLGLAAGSEATAIFKASSVVVGA